MKAKLVSESLDFDRDAHPYSKLGIGKVTADNLKPGYYIFGGKGDSWSDNAHIAGKGSTTLCGKPMLSFNSCKGMDPGCKACIDIYRKENS
jgi:hypothetical protein